MRPDSSAVTTVMTSFSDTKRILTCENSLYSLFATSFMILAILYLFESHRTRVPFL